MSLKNYKIDKHIDTYHTHNLSGKDMAGMFWEMDELEMVEFFNELGHIEVESKAAFIRQMLAVAGNKELGDYVIGAIGAIASIIDYRKEGEHG